MIMVKWRLLICTILFSLLPAVSCQKAEKGGAPESAPAMFEGDTSSEKPMSVSDLSGPVMEQEAPGLRKDEESRGLMGHFLAPMDIARDRLLEYRVDLTYESDDISRSRQELLAIVAKYGFIREGAASIEDQPPVATADVLVKSDKIYEALQLFEKVGTLLEEKITVTDHTEAMVLQERTLKREQLRIARKNTVSTQVAPAAKNWSDIENSLAQSEDRLDAADQAKWKITDKVAWALIHVSLKGPDRVVVPNYLNAVVGMINFLLRLVWGIIYFLPIVVIAGLIVWKRKQIAGVFRRKKKE